MGLSNSRPCGVCYETITKENKVKLCVCNNTYCRPCLEAWFTSIYNSGFNGSCPSMKCPGCKLNIPMQTWSPIMPAEVREGFIDRAYKVLSLQCGGCHTRKSLMVETALRNESEYEAAKESAVPLFGGPTQLEAFLKNQLPKFERQEGDEYKPEAFFQYLQSILVGFDNEEDKHTMFKKVLALVRDPERRANLHLRFLRHYPRVRTTCCNVDHCSRCHKREFHVGMTCEQYQASKAADEILTCPNCNIFLVKGDGCNSVNCVCGRNFNWADRLNQMKQLTIDAFITRFNGDVGASVEAASILWDNTGKPQEDVYAAGLIESMRSQLLAEGRSRLWQRLHPHYTLITSVGLSSDRSKVSAKETPLLDAYLSSHGAEVTAYQQQVAKMRSDTFCLFFEEPAVMAYRITQEQLPASAELRRLATAHWQEMPTVMQSAAARASTSLYAQSWVSRHGSLEAAARAYVEHELLHNLTLIPRHPHHKEASAFRDTAEYHAVVEEASKALDRVQLFTTAWANYVQRKGTAAAVEVANSILSSKGRFSPAASIPTDGIISFNNVMAELLSANSNGVNLARRTVPANDELVQILQEWLAQNSPKPVESSISPLPLPTQISNVPEELSLAC